MHTLRTHPVCFLIILLAGIHSGVPAVAGQFIWHVDQDAPPGGFGATWATAFNDLKDALDVAIAGDEIRVAAGTYKPDRGTGDRAVSFELVSGVALYGGYAGFGEPDPDERDVLLYETTLSGAIGGSSQNDNTYQIVKVIGVDANTILDGFTIYRGKADAPAPNNAGAGLYISGGSPILRNLKLLSNSSASEGAGIYNTGNPSLTSCLFQSNGTAGMFNSGSPTLTDCIFNSNSGTGFVNTGSPLMLRCTFANNSGVYGGGFSSTGGNSRFLDCVFDSNEVVPCNSGGGVYASATVSLVRCKFIANTACCYGGGVYSSGSNLSCVNCTFLENQITNTLSQCGGGAIYTTSATTIANSLFSGNSAAAGGGAVLSPVSAIVLANCTIAYNNAGTADGGGVSLGDQGATIENCILWGNADSGGLTQSAQVYLHGTGSTVNINHSCLQGWTGSLGGTGNTGANPFFIDPDGMDDVVGTLDDDLHLFPISPLIDAGDNAAVPADLADLDDDGDIAEPLPLDLDDEPRFVDGDDDLDVSVDMGAYEFQMPDQDCNSNGVPDFLDISTGSSADCNSNSIPDECDIAAGTAADEDGNQVPDVCEADCNENGVIDDMDISAGTSQDCDGDGTPDECQADFDGDGLIDACDPDIDDDGVPNESDVCDFTPLVLPPQLVEADGGVLGDVDGDCDVDLVDFAMIQERFTGPG